MTNRQLDAWLLEKVFQYKQVEDHWELDRVDERFWIELPENPSKKDFKVPHYTTNRKDAIDLFYILGTRKIACRLEYHPIDEEWIVYVGGYKEWGLHISTAISRGIIAYFSDGSLQHHVALPQ